MDYTGLVPANSRGGTVLLHEGYRYRKKSQSKDQFRWICTVNGCYAYTFTNKFDYTRENILGMHSKFFILS